MCRSFIATLIASLAASTQLFEQTENFYPDAFDVLQSESNGWSAVTAKVDGVSKTLYVAINSNKSSGSTITIPYGQRGYLSESASLDPTKFFKPNLLGGSVEYDVDLSTRNCGCIAAFYLVSMPGKKQDGTYWNTDGYYYCDANQVGGNYCPEFDIMEANQWAT